MSATVQNLQIISPSAAPASAPSIQCAWQLLQSQNVKTASHTRFLRNTLTNTLHQPATLACPQIQPVLTLNPTGASSISAPMLDVAAARRLLILQSIQNEATQRRAQATLQLERLKARAILVRALQETTVSSSTVPKIVGGLRRSHQSVHTLMGHKPSTTNATPPKSQARSLGGGASMSTKDPAEPINGEAILEYLGKRRRESNNPYLDASIIRTTGNYNRRHKKKATAGSGATETFPELLYRMLHEVRAQGQADIVAFLPHGRAFWAIDVSRFETQIMPQYFQHSKWASFSRQLNLYGFGRITDGPDDGAYYHELFLNGRPDLCRYLRRNGVPQRGKDRRKDRRRKEAGDDPDFYSVAPITKL